MRNLFGILTVTALVLLTAGQAAAYFTEGDLICVVYTTAGNRVEEAFDLGPVANLPSSGAYTANLAINLSSFGSGVSYSQLNVSYFAMSADESTFWVTGALMPVATTLYAQAQATLSGGLHYYGYSSAAPPPYSIGNPDSYYYLFDGNGAKVGLMGGLLASGYSMEASLSAGGSASQNLYKLTISPDGSAVTASSTGLTIHTQAPPVNSPVPAAGLLFGSGLAVLAAVRRAIGNRAPAVDRG
jgi:hypothetical protein